MDVTTDGSGVLGCDVSLATLHRLGVGTTGEAAGVIEILSGVSAGALTGDGGAIFECGMSRCWTAPTTEGEPGVVGLEPTPPFKGVVGLEPVPPFKGVVGLESASLGACIEGGTGAGGAARYAGGAGAGGAPMRSLLDCGTGGAGARGGAACSIDDPAGCEPPGDCTSCSCSGSDRCSRNSWIALRRA